MIIRKPQFLVAEPAEQRNSITLNRITWQRNILWLTDIDPLVHLIVHLIVLPGIGFLSQCRLNLPNHLISFGAMLYKLAGPPHIVCKYFVFTLRSLDILDCERPLYSAVVPSPKQLPFWSCYTPDKPLDTACLIVILGKATAEVRDSCQLPAVSSATVRITEKRVREAMSPSTNSTTNTLRLIWTYTVVKPNCPIMAHNGIFQVL
jgi:hypothetical protein